MHRIAFPFSLCIGTDTVYLPRIRRLISERDGRRIIPFAKRILHPLELLDLRRRHPQWETHDKMTPTGLDSLVTWLGGRFAAKEAARKAVGATALGWKDVRIEVGSGSGQPHIIYIVRDASSQDVEHEAKLSISHDGNYAVATVLAAAIPDLIVTDVSKGQ